MKTKTTTKVENPPVKETVVVDTKLKISSTLVHDIPGSDVLRGKEYTMLFNDGSRVYFKCSELIVNNELSLRKHNIDYALANDGTPVAGYMSWEYQIIGSTLDNITKLRRSGVKIEKLRDNFQTYWNLCKEKFPELEMKIPAIMFI